MFFTIIATLGLLLTIYVEPMDIKATIQHNVIPALTYFTIALNSYIILRSAYLIYVLWFQPELADMYSILGMFLCGLVAMYNVYRFNQK